MEEGEREALNTFLLGLCAYCFFCLLLACLLLTVCLHLPGLLDVHAVGLHFDIGACPQVRVRFFHCFTS